MSNIQMRSNTKKGKKGRTGKDGKTKQQRYVERNRAKINAANNQRNKEAGKKQNLLKGGRSADLAEENAAVESPAPEEGGEASYSDDSNFDIALALSLPCSDGPLPCSDPPSPFDESDDDQDPFNKLSDQFVRWSNLIDEMMGSFGMYWSAREGWKPEQLFTLTRFESRFYTYSLRAKSILSSARRLLCSLTPGDAKWEEVLNMIKYLAALDTFMATIRNSCNEKPANNVDNSNLDM